MRIVPIFAVTAAALTVASCGKKVDELQRLIQDKTKPGNGDAIALLEDSKKTGVPGATTVLDGPGGRSNEAEPYEILPPGVKGAAPAAKAPVETVKPDSKAEPKSEAKSAEAKGKYADEAEIVRLVKAHKYQAALKLNPNPKSFQAQYYAGNAAFVTALEKKADSPERQKLVLLAEKRFRQAGAVESNPTKKARAYLWLGITGYKFRLGDYDYDTLTKPFRYIHEKLANTPYDNDAVFYLGLLSMKSPEKRGTVAAEYFASLAKSDPRDRVYDVDYARFSTPQAAAKHYSALLNGEGADLEGAVPTVTGSTSGAGTGAGSGSTLKAPAVRPGEGKDDFLEKVDRLHREILGGSNSGANRETPRPASTGTGAAQNDAPPAVPPVASVP